MSEISNISKTFFAYLSRPHLYPELARKIYKNIFNRKAAFKGKDDAALWCAKNAISQEKTIAEILGFKNYTKIEELYPEILAEAKSNEKNCPVKMGGAGALDLIFYINEYLKAENAVETGVAYGWSSLAALLSIEKRNGTLYSSDMPYLGKENDQYVGCVVPENLTFNWQLFRFADRESLPKIFKIQDSIDFVHYDSDKSYDGRMWAYPLLFKHLRKGGVLMSDDIGDNAAFMDFCLQNNYESIVVEFDEKYAGFIFKK
ncbi:class I SAM-dependent methyltransferase [Halpernia frigidisoli]|uniref:Methyltransferase domain-containing protein n=1 Tax=Halpernia frigidisoli TaxID=1125876 RepID=A0A1I3GLX6_9FLAO|nr:class I SAM-dependent methyltransferase [Halpernia frigidisoli]SFI24473.1 Methyltransferase domain-containing protein [Halpernia frigidisoli]